jgi:hypothetical protein
MAVTVVTGSPLWTGLRVGRAPAASRAAVLDFAELHPAHGIDGVMPTNIDH